MKKLMLFFALALFFPPTALADIVQDVVQDHKNFYSGKSLRNLAIGIGIAGVKANTLLDEEIQDWYQRSLRSKVTDEISEKAKLFGEGTLTVPVYFGATILGALTYHTKVGAIIGEWGSRSLRTLLVGAPPMLFLQTALGAGRPVEGGSNWRPFNDNNAVSGHGFMGAIPFITAAKMTENPILKYVLYYVSGLTALSRINDDAHYSSQSALGWWIAYLAAASFWRLPALRKQKQKKRSLFLFLLFLR